MSDTDYDNFLQYLTAEHFTSFSVIITLVVILIIIGVMSSSENNKTSLAVLSIVSVLLLGLFLLYQYNNYTSFEKDYTARQKKIQDDADADVEAENETLLETNAICNVNPNLCMNGGSCQSFGEDKQQFRCTCTAGWTGNNCNTPDNITISDSDVDSRCSDKTTGEKKPNLEWCNANFDGRGGKCVDKQKYQIDCPINRDGTPNFKYNEYGCDVDNDEVWCEETSADSIGKCLVRSAQEVGEPCNSRTISQDCGGRRCLDWHNGKGTCVANNQNEMVYNAKTDGCNTFECSKYDGDQLNCSNTFYCNYNNNKCKVKSREHCQSKDKTRCEDDSNCLWDDRHSVCSDKKSSKSYGSDCVGYSKNPNICNRLPHCIYDNSSNICKYNASKESSGNHIHIGVSNDINIDFYSDLSGDDCSGNTIPFGNDKCQMVINGYTPPAPAPVVAQVVAPVTAQVTVPAQPAEPATTTTPPAAEGFKVGGRIKDTFVVSSNGFVVSGYSDF